MALPALLDRMRQHLDSSLSPVPPLIGDGYPVAADELPAVTVSIAEVVRALRGIGRLPAPTLTGALRVDSSLDLADPVRVVRRTRTCGCCRTTAARVQLAHGPLVRADGTATRRRRGRRTSPSSAAARRSRRSTGRRARGEVQVLPETGGLRFPSTARGHGHARPRLLRRRVGSPRRRASRARSASRRSRPTWPASTR